MIVTDAFQGVVGDLVTAATCRAAVYADLVGQSTRTVHTTRTTSTRISYCLAVFTCEHRHAQLHIV